MLSAQVDAGGRRVLEVFLETARKSLLTWFDGSSFQFGQRPAFDAWTSLEQGQPRFYFQLGCGFALYDLFMSLISHPDFFPELPLDESAGVIPGPDRDDRFCDYTWVASTPPPAEQRFLPQRMTLDAPRYALGDHLFEMAVRFLFYHQQMHYLLGHLELARRAGPDFTLFEIAATAQESVPPELLRALELEADGDAAALLFHAGRDEAERRRAHLPAMHRPLDWDRALLAAVGAVFMLVEWNQRHASGMEPEAHPSAAARTLNVFRLHAHIAAAGPRGDPGARIFVVQRVLGDLAVAAECLPVQPMRPKDFLAGSPTSDQTPAFRECESDRAQLRLLLPVLQPCRETVAGAMGFRPPVPPSDEDPEWFEARAWQAPSRYIRRRDSRA
jgi:hypothetical protein